MKPFLNIILCFLLSFKSFAQTEDSLVTSSNYLDEFTFITPNSFRLKNGITVIVEKDTSSLSTLKFSINIREHSDYDNAGIDSIINRLLKKNHLAWVKANNNYLHNSNASAYYTNAHSLKTTVPNQYFKEVLQGLSKTISAPKFNEEDVFIEKRILIDSLLNTVRTPQQIMEQVGNTLAYGYQHPYGERPSSITINAITAFDIEQHYNQYVTPQNTKLYIKTGLDIDTIKQKLYNTLTTWKNPNTSIFKIPQTENVQYTQFNLVNVVNSETYQLQFTNTNSLKFNSKNYVASVVALEVLSAQIKAQQINADVCFDIKPLATRFILKHQTTSETIVKNTKTLLKTIDNIRTSTVTLNEIKNAKNAIKQNLKDIEGTPTKEFYNTLDKVTADDIRFAAITHFKTNEMRIIIAGDIRRIYNDLETIKRKNKTLPKRFYNTKGARINVLDFMKQIPNGTTLNHVFQNYINAIGGFENVLKVKALSIAAKASINGTTLTLNIKKASPSHYLSELLVEGNVMSKLVVKDSSGYVFANQKRVVLNPKQVSKAQLKSFPFLETQTAHSELLRIDSINDKETYVVKFANSTEEYYDIKTGLKLQSIAFNDEGKKEVTTQYSNYKSIEGILFPTVITQYILDTKVTFTIQEIIINPVFKDNQFK